MPANRFGERQQRQPVVDLRLQSVVEHQLEAVRIGIQYDDRHGDSRFAQRDALVGKSNGQKAYPLLLEHVRHFERSGPVSGGLDHGHHLNVFVQQAAEVVQIVDHVVEVDL